MAQQMEMRLCMPQAVMEVVMVDLDQTLAAP
jgi:hypothetical protein